MSINLAESSDNGSRVLRVPLAADLEARVEVAGDTVDVRLWRRAGTPGAAFCRTDAGLRIPAHLAPLLSEAINRAARRTGATA